MCMSGQIQSNPFLDIVQHTAFIPLLYTRGTLLEMIWATVQNQMYTDRFHFYAVTEIYSHGFFKTVPRPKGSPTYIEEPFPQLFFW